MSEASAQCAVHAGVPAVFVCERCGSFGCDTCRSSAGSTFCRACKAPIPAILQGGLDFSSLIRGALQGISGNLRALALLALAWFIATHVVNFVVLPALMYASVDITRDAWLLVTVLPVFILAIFFNASIIGWMGESFLERRRRSLLRALGAGPAHMFKLTPLWILSGATWLFRCGALNLAALFLPVAWTLALTGVILGRYSGWDALSHTWMLTRGHRWSLLILFAGYHVLVRVLSVAVMKGSTYLSLYAPESVSVVNFFLPLLDVPWRILFVTTFTLFYLRRTQGAAAASWDAGTVPGADGR